MYEGEVAVPEAPLALEVMVVAARPVIVPPPLAAVATWKKLEKLAPVPAVPMFEIVEEKVRAVPAVAVDGVGAPAVRSGRGAAATVTVIVSVPVRPAPSVAVSLKV